MLGSGRPGMLCSCLGRLLAVVINRLRLVGFLALTTKVGKEVFRVWVSAHAVGMACVAA